FMAPHYRCISPGTLVHEAYLKMRRSAPAQCRDRRHFCALSARMMRFILIDFLREGKALKRNGEAVTISEPSSNPGLEEDSSMTILDVNEALEELTRLDQQKARVVELRFFAGMSLEETGEVMGISVATV